METGRFICSLLAMLATMATWADDTFIQRNCRQGNLAVGSTCHRASNQLFSTDSYQGKRRQLVVFASFADRTFNNPNPDDVLMTWDPVFNEEGYHENSYVGSVHDYFYDQSYGQFDLSFDLQYVELSEPCRKYRSTNDDDENSKYLVCDIVDTLLTRSIDWNAYDWNGDGYINQLLIIYAGLGMGAGGDSNSIWPHQWWLSKHADCEPRMVSDGTQQYFVDAYACVQEKINNSSTFGNICHEYSHCLGLPDFYYGDSSFLYDWDLMDRGNYNGNGYRPCGYSAHERMFMGWLKPIELTQYTTVSDMQPLDISQQAYIIYNDSHPDEYYTIENRQKERWDESLPGNGIIVFHVNYNESMWKYGTPNSNSRKNYMIFPANNNTSRSTLKNWGYPYLENDSLTNTSKPASTLYNQNVDGTLLMSKPITEMSVVDGVASFSFMADTMLLGVESLQQDERLSGYTVLYTLGPVAIVRCEDGTVKKVAIPKTKVY